MIPISRVRSRTAMTIVSRSRWPQQATRRRRCRRGSHETREPLSICSMTCFSENALNPSSAPTSRHRRRNCESSDSMATPLYRFLPESVGVGRDSPHREERVSSGMRTDSDACSSKTPTTVTTYRAACRCQLMRVLRASPPRRPQRDLSAHAASGVAATRLARLPGITATPRSLGSRFGPARRSPRSTGRRPRSLRRMPPPRRPRGACERASYCR